MTVLAARRVLTPAGVLEPGWVELTSGRIAQVASGSPAAHTELFDWLVPGFVDGHCHGGGGGAFDSGDAEQIQRAAAAHLRHGTTTLVASLVSAPRPVLADQVRALAAACEAGLIAGIHLEGPWLSPRYRGAHDATALRDPDAGELESLLAAGRGHLRLITIAPELPGALPVIRAAVAAGVTVAVGHTDATYAQTSAAIEAGATVATHLANRMRPLLHRDPGPVAALTEDPRVTVELVADGVHLDPAVLRLLTRATVGSPAVVTDAMAAAACGDGFYRLGAVEVHVVDGVPRTSDDALAGSTLTSAAAVRNYVASGAATVLAAVTAATATPARALGLAAGVIEVGARADLVGLTDDLTVTAVWHAGAEVVP